MKTNLYLLSLLLSFSFFCHSQNPENQFGKISINDFNPVSLINNQYANAAVLFDTGVSSFERNNDYFEIIFERKTRIKILNNKGVSWGQFEIPYYHEGDVTEHIKEVEAYSYTVENYKVKTLKLDISSATDSVIDKNWSIRKFSIPNVKSGSIIEYHYILSSEFKQNFRNWTFQWKIPVFYSKYITRMIPYYQYAWNLQAVTKFDSQTSFVDNTSDRKYGNTKYNDVVYEYVMRDLPAFEETEYISSPEDYLVRINFQLSKILEQNGTSKTVLTSWQDITNELVNAENFGVFLQKSEKIASKLLNIPSLKSMPKQQSYDSVMNFVKKNYSWNGMDKLYSTKSIMSFLKDKSGNLGEINLFTIGLLKACGISSTPMLLSTREHGKIKPEFPNIDAFNYIGIYAAIDSLTQVSDASNSLIANDLIPINCLNDRGLLIQKDKVDWIGLQSLKPSSRQSKLVLTVSEKDINSVVEYSNNGYFAIDWRTNFGDDKELILKNLKNKGYEVNITSINVQNPVASQQPYVIHFNTIEKTDKQNDSIYISPFLKENLKFNPLKSPSRILPIDLIYSYNQAFYSEINIPSNYNIKYLPENEKIKNERFEFEYYTSVEENKIKVKLSYYFKLPIYSPDDYLKLKYYFKEIVTKSSDKIILKKKN